MKTLKRLLTTHPNRLLFFLVPLLSLVAIQPILTGILPWRGDGLLHLVRLAELERAVRAGVMFPRWSPDLGYGFGFPLFHYYAPFSYYVGLIPRLSGFSLPASLALSYLLALWVLGWGVALWARDVWREWLGVITAVLATLYAPYLLYNTYHRAALAELWGLAWLALLLWAVNKAIDDFRLPIGESSLSQFTRQLSNFIWIAVFYALLILSHNITALIGTPFILGYALFLLIGKRPFSLHSSSFILLSLLLGLALSAFFWLPAFFERNLVQIENLTATSGFTYLNHFLTWLDLLAWPKTAVPQQVNPAIPRSLSWPVVALALVAWLPVKGARDEGQGASIKAQRLGLTGAAMLCIFMLLPFSQLAWQAVGLLSFVQFPWRFLGPASVFLAMLAGLGAIQFQARLTSQFTGDQRPPIISQFIILITALILLFALPWLFPSRAHTLPIDLSPANTIQFEMETGWLGTTAAADYLPRSVQTLPLADVTRSGLSATQLPAPLIVQNGQTGFTQMQFDYELGKATTVTGPVEVTAVAFHQFFFPGWQATLDGAPLALAPSEPEGLITAVLPPGEHSFELTFNSTPLRTIANLISVVSLVGLVILMAYCVLRSRQSYAIRNPVLSNAKGTQYLSNIKQTLLPAVLTVLFIFSAKIFILDHVNSPFKVVRFDEQTLATVQGINFGNVIKLLNAELPNETIPADGNIDITLAWQALPPVAEEYSVSVQLLGENGRRVAQSDSFHPAGLPLPRWQAGEFGIDEHRLKALPATPPGDYRLLVLVYNLASGQRLDMLNETGLPLGNEYELGRVTLTSPTQFPQVSHLAISQTNTEGGGISPFLAENVQLLGYDAPLTAVTVGDVIPLTLYWHTPQTPTQDYKSNIWIGCASTSSAAVEPVETDTSTGSAAVSLPPDTASTPNTTWQRGQIQRAEFDVVLRSVDEAGNLLEPGFCTLYLGLSADGEVNSIALETFTISVPERLFTLPETAVPMYTISFVDKISLSGFILNQTSFVPTETIPLTLFWQTDGLIETSYTVFVQMLDENGRLITQQDQIPANGNRPTTGWVPGEFVEDRYALVLPVDVAPGHYQIITGFYDAETGERLRLADSSGDAITIPVSIEVKTAE